MSNRFKFRIWHKIRKAYLNNDSGEFFIDLDGKVFRIDFDMDHINISERVVIEQFTGLKDAK